MTEVNGKDVVHMPPSSDSTDTAPISEDIVRTAENLTDVVNRNVDGVLDPSLRQKDPVEVLKNFVIKIPPLQELTEMTVPQLYAVWIENHRRFIDVLERIGPAHIPFFGTHGTYGGRMEGIQARPNLKRIRLATFYERLENTERALEVLYSIARHAAYAAFHKKGPSAIMVFNLEKDGKNIAMPWDLGKGYQKLAGSFFSLGGYKYSTDPDSARPWEHYTKL